MFFQTRREKKVNGNLLHRVCLVPSHLVALSLPSIPSVARGQPVSCRPEWGGAKDQQAQVFKDKYRYVPEVLRQRSGAKRSRYRHIARQYVSVEKA